MRRAGLALCTALVLITDVVVLLGVMRNRAGESDSVIEVTERELGLPYLTNENTGISLTLRWNVRDIKFRYQSPSWFGKSKLEELGFDCSYPLSDSDSSIWYQKALPRETYVVMEYEGTSWEEWLASEQEKLAELALEVERQENTADRLERAREHFENSVRGMSRLFVIDVNNDPALLRKRYPDPNMFIITRAIVRLGFDRYAQSIDGTVSAIMIDEVHVSREHRRVLDDIRAEEGSEDAASEWAYRSYPLDKEPRYTVRLRYGRRYEPWVEDVRRVARTED